LHWEQKKKPLEHLESEEPMQNMQLSRSAQFQSQANLQRMNDTVDSQFIRKQTNMNFCKSNAFDRKFTDEEMQKTKYLVDKVSGVFDIDKRYLVKESKSQVKLPPIAEEAKEKADEKKRPITQLDKYIDLILKNVINVDEFIYLACWNEEDPYDLQVVKFSKIKDDTMRDYYTISKKGLCHYVDGKPSEFVQLAYWLKERETYDHIKSLRFFTKFRKWKTMKMWRKNVICHKIQKSSRALEGKLFQLHPIMGACLKKHRNLTLEMSAQRFFETSITNYGSEVPTLEQFKGVQERRRK